MIVSKVEIAIQTLVGFVKEVVGRFLEISWCTRNNWVIGNNALWHIVFDTSYFIVGGTVNGAVHRTVDVVVYDAISRPLDRAVYRAVIEVVVEAVDEAVDEAILTRWNNWGEV